jgi:hypothetical protein
VWQTQLLPAIAHVWIAQCVKHVASGIQSWQLVEDFFQGLLAAETIVSELYDLFAAESKTAVATASVGPE